MKTPIHHHIEPHSMKMVYPIMSRPGQSQAIKAMLQKAAAVTPTAFSEMSFNIDHESHVIYYIKKGKKAIRKFQCEDHW